MSIPSVLMANAGREQQVLSFQQKAFVAVVNGITLAQLNAGFNILQPVHGRQLRVLNYRIVVNSATIAAVTDIRLGSTDATPVVIVTIAQAGLTSGARFSAMSTTNTTHGVGLAAKLGSGVGIKLYKTGSDATGAFTIDLYVEYDVI